MGRADSVLSNRDAAGGKRDHYRPAVVELAGIDQKKTARPTRRRGTVRRDRLLRDLAAIADDVSLILVSAPAGYGKTTVLSQWAAEDRRPFAWAHLDEADNDPVRLLRHIALALHRIHPLDFSVWRALSSPHASLTGVALPRLLAATTAAASPWVLVLDDIHVLRASLGPDVVVAFADGLPAGCHVVVSGRKQPGLKLGGLRTQGKCVEIGPRELAFSAEEAGIVLATAGSRLSDRAVADLQRRAEGWPAGIYLAALSMRGCAEPDVAAGEIAGSTAFIFDYLHEEVLLHEPAETVQFLLRTAPLRQLSGPLCDAVLGTGGSAARLAEMESRNLFVVPQDTDRHWYRYHPLFGEMLLAELRRRDPAEEPCAHRRAADWYERQGLPEQAVAHALAGQDTRNAARLVVMYSQRYVNMGRVHTVRDWLRTLADGAMESYPPLAVIAGWIWALTGDAARAQECLHSAEHGSLRVAECDWLDDATPGGGTELVSGIARLRAALAPLGVERMLVDAAAAFDLEPPGGAWYPMAASLLGVAQMLNGDPEAATGTLERAAHFGREHQRSAASFALAELALIFVEQDDWTMAESCVVEASALVEAGHLMKYPPSLAVYVAQARVALHRRDVRLARQSVNAALRLYAEPSPAAFPWLAAQMAIGLGRVLLDMGDYPAAQPKVIAARRHLARLSTDGVLGQEHRQLVRDVSRQGDRVRQPIAMTLTAAEMRVLRLLPTHLTLSEVADALFISRNTVKTQVASIYGKLLASSRAEAVRAAREFGLID